MCKIRCGFLRDLNQLPDDRFLSADEIAALRGSDWDALARLQAEKKARAARVERVSLWCAGVVVALLLAMVAYSAAYLSGYHDASERDFARQEARERAEGFCADAVRFAAAHAGQTVVGPDVLSKCAPAVARAAADAEARTAARLARDAHKLDGWLAGAAR